jgi:hypothetical protein
VTTTVSGHTYATAEELREQLGDDVTAELLRDWKRRGLVTAHRVGRVNWYRVDEAIEAEWFTRGKTNRRRAA